MSILIIVYLCGVFPLLLGAMGKHFLQKAELPIYVLGHGMQFAFLFLCSLVVRLIKCDVISFARVYLMITIAVGIFCVIVVVRCFKEYVPAKLDLPHVLILLMELGLMAVSILICVPHWNDMTEEVLYQLHFTGVLTDVDYLYAGVLQVLTGMNPVTFVRLWLPLFLLPLFYCAYHYFARGRVWFLVFAYALYTSFIAIPGYVGMQVFLNIWNPVTMSITVWMPLFFYLLVQMVWKKEERKPLLPELVIVLLALLGLLSQAWLYMLVLILAMVIIRASYGIYDKRGGKES